MQLLLDWGPLLAFFIAYKKAGLFVATAVLMGTTLVAVAVDYWKKREIAVMPLITLALVTLFGGLTLWLQDEEFIKMKPTFIYLLFALILGIGILRKKGLISAVLGKAFTLSDAAWVILSKRFALFFLGAAILNEVIWRNCSTDTWIWLKTFGFLPLTFVFVVMQMPLVKREGKEVE